MESRGGTAKGGREGGEGGARGEHEGGGGDVTPTYLHSTNDDLREAAEEMVRDREREKEKERERKR